MLIRLMSHFEHDDITKISTLGTLACMAPKNILDATHFLICLCIPIEELICVFASLEKLQQLRDAILPFFMNEQGLPVMVNNCLSKHMLAN
jgi:hypothetical protein